MSTMQLARAENRKLYLCNSEKASAFTWAEGLEEAIALATKRSLVPEENGKIVVKEDSCSMLGSKMA